MTTKTTSTTAITDRAIPRIRTLVSIICFGVVLTALIASAVFTVSSASSAKHVGEAAAKPHTDQKGAQPRPLAAKWFSPLLPLPPAPPETLATYEVVAGACTNTLKDSFTLGESVCVKSSAPLEGRRLSVAGTDGTIADIIDVTTDPQELIVPLPSTTTSVVNGSIIDNRGKWRAIVHSSYDFGSRAVAFFSVTDPDNAAADLVVFNDSTATDTVAPGDPTGFQVYLRNDGPDPAAAVHVKQTVPSNMTFNSASAGTGTSFTCSQSGSVVDCVPSGNLASGATSSFTLNYTVSGGALNTIMTSEVDISSTTTDPHPDSNSAIAKLEIRAAGSSPPTCSVACPLNRTVAANTTQGGQDGAIVNFAGAIESTGDCGTVSSVPASGSFFPLGVNTVSVSSTTGGGSCSFTITVVSAAAPTISCASDQTAQVSGSSNEASVTVNPPTVTGTNVQLTSVRNDNRSVSDSYPIGTTTITWTATECNDANPADCSDPTKPHDPNARSASCTQRIIVTSADAPTISCPSDKTFNASGCSTSLTAAQIGTPTATGTDITVTGTRSDHLDLYTDPYPAGQTVITWAATENNGTPNDPTDDGRVASCSQIITITSNGGGDTEPPTLTIPPDVSVTTTSCSALLDDELGVASADDNCSPSVNISRSGIPMVSCPIPGNPTRMCESFVFPTGTTNITYTATDGAGNSTTKVQHVTVHENTPPTITAPANASYQCASDVPAANASQATASDNCGAPAVTVTQGTNGGAGSTASPLIITRTFTATDASGNSTDATQTITVIDNTAPTITAPANAGYQCASNVPGASPSQATASDNCTSTPTVAVSESNNGGLGSTSSPLVITRVYTATDAAGNSASATQTITVIDNTAPVISLNQSSQNPQYVECHTSYPELGASASDNCSGSFAATPSGSVDVNTPGTYTITYNATDAAGNAATPVNRTVIVRDTIAPVITRNGAASVTVECHTSYTDAGATASDTCDTSVPVSTANPVNVNVVGDYTVTYTASDDSGNAATPVTRLVMVRDTTPPVINLNSYAPSMWPPNHKYSTFQLTQFVTGATDSCNTSLGLTDVVIEKVTSDEIENGNGDGNTLNDIVIASDCKSVQLRSEREGNGNGRVYTITFKVTDASGNVGRATAKVVVPHNPGDAVVDSGAHYTVNGSCP